MDKMKFAKTDDGYLVVSEDNINKIMPKVCTALQTKLGDPDGDLFEFLYRTELNSVKIYDNYEMFDFSDYRYTDDIEEVLQSYFGDDVYIEPETRAIAAIANVIVREGYTQEEINNQVKEESAKEEDRIANGVFTLKLTSDIPGQIGVVEAQTQTAKLMAEILEDDYGVEVPWLEDSDIKSLEDYLNLLKTKEISSCDFETEKGMLEVTLESPISPTEVEYVDLEEVEPEEELEEDINFYNQEEVEKVMEHPDNLLIIETDEGDFYGRYEDLADIIYKCGLELGDLKIYDSTTGDLLCSTFGYFLDKCNPDTRKDIIDRLVDLQQGNVGVKEIKLIDPEDVDPVNEDEVVESLNEAGGQTPAERNAIRSIKNKVAKIKGVPINPVSHRRDDPMEIHHLDDTKDEKGVKTKDWNKLIIIPKEDKGSKLTPEHTYFHKCKDAGEVLEDEVANETVYFVKDGKLEPISCRDAAQIYVDGGKLYELSEEELEESIEEAKEDLAAEVVDIFERIYGAWEFEEFLGKFEDDKDKAINHYRELIKSNPAEVIKELEVELDSEHDLLAASINDKDKEDIKILINKIKDSNPGLTEDIDDKEVIEPEEENEEPISKNKGWYAFKFADIKDTLKVYLAWEGIIGYDNTLMEFKDYTDLSEYLIDEGITGYTRDIWDILQGDMAICNDMNERDFIEVCEQEDINPEGNQLMN